MESNSPLSNKYFIIIEQIDDAIFITNRGGLIEYVNPAFERMTGFTKEEAIGKTPRIIKSGKQDREFYIRLWKTIVGGKVWRAVLVNKKKNGELIYVDHTITPIKDKSGKIVQFAGLWKDISLQYQMDKRKDEFISIASHEIKTPLASIKAYSQLMQEKLKKIKDKDMVKFTTRLNNQIERLNKLIYKLLDASRIREGKLVLRKTSFDMGQLVYETVKQMEELAPNQMIIINKLNKEVYADTDRIGQVLTNLLANAVKFSPKSKKIIIEVRQKGHEAVTSVEDFGPGIDPADQERIFERFFQVKSLRRKHDPSLGLGLSIASDIISAHEGKIWVKSEKGRGAKFFFSIPI